MSTEFPGGEMYALVKELYPICRSITGDGVRQTLQILRRVIPLELHEVPSGTQVLDWQAPREWNIRDAWIKDPSGKKIVDFHASNLQVVSYSTPVHRHLPLSELKNHLFTLPDRPDWIPYRTSYYKEAWGFCLPHELLQRLPEGDYEVYIDSSLEPGHLTYGELLIPGERDEEILISAHVCHPSLCNDNLSGVAVSAFLAREVLAQPQRRLSYRFLFIPGTIGAITWLAQNRESLRRVSGGLTLVCLGDSRHLTYKKSFSGDAAIDRAACYVLAQSGEPWETIDFFPYGYDERQFNSPGFRLAVGSLMRSRHGQFPEYHTSADNLDFVSSQQLGKSLAVLRRIVTVLDQDRRLLNKVPYGEPQLGKHGLYGDMMSAESIQDAILWILSFSDGDHGLLDICQRSGLPFELICRAAGLLEEHGLVGES
jgi:aminopeptidase-like protein